MPPPVKKGGQMPVKIPVLYTNVNFWRFTLGTFLKREMGKDFLRLVFNFNQTEKPFWRRRRTWSLKNRVFIPLFLLLLIIALYIEWKVL